MRKWWARIGCLLLALLLAASALPVFAAGDESVLEEDAQEDVTDDFVILLDCSMSTSANDTKNLCLQACWDFLDKLPIYDTRVSIMTFGYEVKDGEDYDYYDDYSSFTVESEADKKLIHEIVPLSELTSSADKEEYKLLVQKALEENRTNSQTWTPYTHALAAAVDMLEKNTDKNASRNACVILISDGVLNDRQMWKEDDNYVVSAEAERLLEEASKQAGTHDWPVYSVQLNYGNSDIREINLARERLERISANGGKNKVGSLECKDDDGVFIALDNIFKDFKMLDIVPPQPVELPGSYYFEVDELASEASIDIFGEGVESVSLYRVDENNERIRDYKTGIKSDLNDQRLIVSAGDGYYALKLICPDEGRWEVYIDGTGSVEVLVSENILSEMRLAIDAAPVTEENPLTKNNTIEVHSYFTYHGINKDDSDIYSDMPAVLKVYDKNNKVIYTVNGESENYSAERNGYHFTLPLNLFPDEEAIRLQVVVEDGRFKDGAKRSAIKNFAFQDLPTGLVEGVQSMSFTKHVGDVFELDMRKIFVNPDGDPLVYTLTCENDPAMKFEYIMEEEKMTIPAGMKPGEYQVTVGVEGEAVKYDQLKLRVINDTPWLDGELPEMVLWSDWYGFQDIGSVVNTLNLNEYFRDSEKMTLTYTLKPSEDGIVTIDNNSGALTLNPAQGVKKAEITVTITAADGITPDSTATAELSVTVKSGKVIFWEQNWIYFAIAAVVLVITVLVIVILLKNKRIKGNWEITVDENGNVDIIDKIDLIYTPHGKKGKCLLKDLMNDLVPYMNDPESMSLILPGYFSGTGAEKVELLGVIRKRGCNVANIPKMGKVQVAVNGVPVKNKASVNGGTITFIIEQGDGMGGIMTISMRLL